MPSSAAGLLNHTRILASAGSGKTYQLATRFLLLTVAGAEPNHILASTFTRIAAGEIRDRILNRLVEAYEHDDKRAALAKEVGRPTLTRDDVLDTLAAVTSRIHRLNVRTIDSFFASINQTFALELDIPPGAAVADEADESLLRTEAIRRMLDENDPQELVELLRLLTQGTDERSVLPTIDRTVVKLYEVFRDTNDAAWECVPELPGKMRLPDVAEAIDRLELSRPSSDKRFIKAHGGDLQNARRQQWDTFLEKGIAAKVAAGEESYYGKPIEQRVLDAYVPLVNHARAVLVGRYRDQTIATRDLLKLFDREFRKLKRERRLITFSDLTDAMLEADALALSDIWYRIDATVHHLLLDEFQDTSIRQWRAMEPMIQEVVSNAPPTNTFFCVGDVKQSVYGWRDAAPEILDQLPDLLNAGDAIKAQEIAASWRSAQPIIDTVNRVFSELAGNAAMAKHPEVVRQWTRWFSHHTTHKQDLAGYAELRIMPPVDRDKGEKADRLRMQEAADLIEELHARNPSVHVGVLTRSNKAVARMLFELHKRDVPASGYGGGPITDAAPVNAVLDLIRMMDHPSDTVSAFNVGASPLGELFDVNWKLAEKSNFQEREAFARRIRQEVAEHGLASKIAEWTRGLAPSCNERELERLTHLAGMARRFDEQGDLRADDFVRLVETTNVAEATPAPVEVMTIHQSKGLEFDAVVLPELESKLEGQSPTVVYERNGVTEPISRICRYMSGSVKDYVPELASVFDQHSHRTVRESLCMLYVAITRARQGLYMFADQTSKGALHLHKLSGLLCTALRENGETSPAYRCGDPDWIDQAIGEATVRAEAADTPPATPITSIRLAASANAPATPAASPSAQAASSDRNTLFARLRLNDRDAAQRGSAIHRLFQEIHWLAAFTPDAAALRDLVLSECNHRDSAWAQEVVDDFLSMIKQPEVAKLMSLGDEPPERFDVWRERRFARLLDGRAVEGVIDRLVIRLDPEQENRPSPQPIGATVIDFKTDDIKLAALAERTRHHEPQITAYREAAAAFLDLDIAAIDARLAFVAIDRVVTLDASLF